MKLYCIKCGFTAAGIAPEEAAERQEWHESHAEGHTCELTDDE